MAIVHPPVSDCLVAWLTDCPIDRFGRNGQPRAADPLMDDRFRRIGQPRHADPSLFDRFGGIGHSSGVFGGTFVDPHIDQRAGHHEYHTNPEWHT